MGYPYLPGTVQRNTFDPVRVRQVRDDVAVVNVIVDDTVRDVWQRVQEARDLVAVQIAAGRATLDAAVADVAAARAVVNGLVADAAQARGVYQTLNQRFAAIEARFVAVETRLAALETP